MRLVLSKDQTARLARRLRRYGITVSDFKCMWKKQRGRCVICNRPFKSTSHAHVEHSHKREEHYRVRGLACFYCNMKFLAPLERGGIERLRRALVHLGWRLR